MRFFIFPMEFQWKVMQESLICGRIILGNGQSSNGQLSNYQISQNQMSRLQHIQNTAARVVTLPKKSCHITPILKELHWLPVSQRIVFKLMLIVHKSFNNIAPIYISELLKVYTPSRNLRSSNICHS